MRACSSKRALELRPLRSGQEMERFFSKLSLLGPTGCWIWTAACTPTGYGAFKRRGENVESVAAHRLAHATWSGPVGGLLVCHRCDTPACCNPDHLFVGTESDNARDRDAKGRQATGERHGSRTKPERVARGLRSGAYTKPESRPRGEKNGRARLTLEQVRELRGAFAAGAKQNDLAHRYGVSRALVYYIVHNKCWKEAA